MSDHPPDHSSIRYLNYREEVRMRMQEYFQHPDLMTLFINAREYHKTRLREAARQGNEEAVSRLSMLDQDEKALIISNITLAQLETLARDIGLCGYSFLESGQPPEIQRFDQYIPLHHHPYLDDLFESALHRELHSLQHRIRDFLEISHLDLDELNDIDQGVVSITVSQAEKISQGVFRPAFEMIKHEYILFAAMKIREYNPFRVFHRLGDLNEETKSRILQYVRYMIQGDQLVTEGEVGFVDRLFTSLYVNAIDKTPYQESLMCPIELSDLSPISQFLPESTLRHILGLIIDCAYADKVLRDVEGKRIIEIANLVLGEYAHP